ncbi:MAG: hypothetical protein CME06_18110 [Gemmatimonadetes bacterium]|nr:hypothetical protein [Gemmatimonadota bacterium]
MAALATALHDAGASPFIVPAMGSHGGGAPAGQVEQLARLGVEAARVGAPILVPEDQRKVARHDSGPPLLLPAPVLDAQGLVLINRVKLHTLFVGPVQSGLSKMLLFGLGGALGAEAAHAHAASIGGSTQRLLPVLEKAVPRLLDAAPPTVGLALVEDETHALSHAEASAGADLLDTDRRLLTLAAQRHPRLPIARGALLIVEEIGKEISGTGLDPHVIGRSVGRRPGGPQFDAILACALSRGTHGNAHGIALADHTLESLVGQIDREVTALNGRTSGAPERGKIPRTHETEELAVLAALDRCAPGPVLQIRNTLALSDAIIGGVSASVLAAIGLDIIEKLPEPYFDQAGSLIHRFE